MIVHVFLLQAAILSSPHGQRALSPGRVVTINTAEHKNALAVILQTENASTQGYSTLQSQLVSSPKERKFEVLVICDAEEHKSGIYHKLKMSCSNFILVLCAFSNRNLKRQG